MRGSQTSVTVNAADDLGLLGDSLSFSVQGVSSAGLVGAPTSSRQCSPAWQPPDAAAMKLLAAGTPQGQTITADLKLVVASGAAPVLADGGNQVTYTYSVDGRSFGPTLVTGGRHHRSRPGRSSTRPRSSSPRWTIRERP